MTNTSKYNLKNSLTKTTTLLTIIFLSLTLLSTGVAADTVSDGEVLNTDTDDTFDDSNPIQDAIDKAEEDQTLLVGPGTYEDSVIINVDGITLEGPNAGISGDSEERGDEATITEGVRWTNKDDITVDGFEVERTIGDGDGVFELGSGGDARIGDNALIKNNVINPVEEDDVPRKAGVLYEAKQDDELRIESNLVRSGDGNVQAINAFEYENSPGIGEGLEVIDNVFNTDYGPVLGVADSSGTVSGNELNNEILGPVVYENGDFSVYNNQFSGNEDTRYVYVDESNSDIDIQDVLDENNFDREVVSSNPSDWDAIVPKSSVDAVNIDQKTGFEEIQSAIDSAEEGDTVEVKEGSYDAPTIDTEGLSLKSVEGAENTEIDGEFVVKSPNVLIDGFRVSSSNDAFEVRSEEVTVSNNTVDDLGDTNWAVHHTTNAGDGLEVTDNNFSDVRAGVYINGQEGHLIEGNTVKDVDYAAVGAEEVSDTQVTSNDLSNNPLGIESFSVGEDVKVNENRFAETDIGVSQEKHGSEVENTVDATRNYWGEPTGPDSSQVEGDVDWRPYYPTEEALENSNAFENFDGFVESFNTDTDTQRSTGEIEEIAEDVAPSAPSGVSESEVESIVEDAVEERDETIETQQEVIESQEQTIEAQQEEVESLESRVENVENSMNDTAQVLEETGQAEVEDTPTGLAVESPTETPGVFSRVASIFG